MQHSVLCVVFFTLQNNFNTAYDKTCIRGFCVNKNQFQSSRAEFFQPWKRESRYEQPVKIRVFKAVSPLYIKYTSNLFYLIGGAEMRYTVSYLLKARSAFFCMLCNMKYLKMQILRNLPSHPRDFSRELDGFAF